MDRFDEFIGVDPKVLPPRPPNAEKGIRDAMTGVCNGEITSDNFVLKWGYDRAPADDEIEQIMAALETSWQYQLNVMAHARPYGTDSYLFNVYVGDSGGCAPSANGMGGYRGGASTARPPSGTRTSARRTPGISSCRGGPRMRRRRRP